jgi:hypothetical protein
MTATAFQDLLALKFAESSYTWNSTEYSQMLLQSGVSIPSGVSMNEYIEKTAPFSETPVEFDFIAPMPYDIIAVIDGTIQGNIKCGVRHDSGSTYTSWTELTKIELKFSTIDDNGNSDILMDFSTVWEGSLIAEDTLQTIGMMYWMNIQDAQIQSDDRLVLTVRLSYSINDRDSFDDHWVRVYCGKDTQDTMLSLPFVMG